MKHHKGQRRSRSLFFRRQQVASGPPQVNKEAHKSHWPAVGQAGSRDSANSGTSYKRSSFGRSHERPHVGQSSSGGQFLPPWGYAAGHLGTSGHPPSYGSRSANVIYPAPPVVAANSAPHYSRTFLLKQQAERDRDAIKRQQRLEVQSLFLTVVFCGWRHRQLWLQRRYCYMRWF